MQRLPLCLSKRVSVSYTWRIERGLSGGWPVQSGSLSTADVAKNALEDADRALHGQLSTVADTRIYLPDLHSVVATSAPELRWRVIAASPSTTSQETHNLSARLRRIVK